MPPKDVAGDEEAAAHSQLQGEFTRLGVNLKKFEDWVQPKADLGSLRGSTKAQLRSDLKDAGFSSDMTGKLADALLQYFDATEKKKSRERGLSGVTSL